jgi:hypothetical protein
MRARRRVIGTRCSVRSPRETVTGGVGRAALAATGAATGPDFGWAATASSLVTRPPRPDPATSAAATPFSSRILRADGLAVPAGTAAAGGGADAAAAFGAAAAGAAAPALASVSMRAISSPETTVSPSALTISTSTPAPGEGTSRTTLSVSMSIRISSRATASPIFFFQEASVPSATDSESWGTWTSIMLIVAPLCSGYQYSIVPSADSISAFCCSLCFARYPTAGDDDAGRDTSSIFCLPLI